MVRVRPRQVKPEDQVIDLVQQPDGVYVSAQSDHDQATQKHNDVVVSTQPQLLPPHVEDLLSGVEEAIEQGGMILDRAFGILNRFDNIEAFKKPKQKKKGR